jgi:hypothetical protein
MPQHNKAVLSEGRPDGVITREKKNQENLFFYDKKD